MDGRARNTTGGEHIPIYEYLCDQCNHAFELLVTRSATPACPRCDGTELQKRVSAPAAPHKSAAIVAAGRALAEREGHMSHYRRVNGKIVD